MTHTLHRLYSDLVGSDHASGKEDGEPPGDYIVMIMACQGFNESGSAPKLRKALDILAAHDPVNMANGEDGIFTGVTPTQLRNDIEETSYVAAAYDQPEQLVQALSQLKEADLGLSVVVTGNPQQTWPLIERADLRPHTVNVSLGVHGRVDNLPEPDIQALTMMCGHGLITPQLAKNRAAAVNAGDITPEEGAREMAGMCTCGVFNTAVARAILREYLGRNEDDN